ncbi:PTS sugar transporter subunit IIB [Barrientosiimonas marina]|uniref:PTS sugar transporter subunit IIB n=1 Tax=Lentibacillus kimchii TaxID=1542911 RepID=A0ABW2UTW0_9BACI
MKKMLIICGTGVATSTVVMEKLKDWLSGKDFADDVELHQGKVSDVNQNWDQYDALIATTIVPKHIQSEVIDGVPLLTGIGSDDVYEKIKERLQIEAA